MTRFRSLPTTAVLAFAAAMTIAGQAPVPQTPSQAPGSQAPTFRSGVDLVTVDVTVLSRSGEPVPSLNAGDFTLLVDGTPRPIVSVRRVEASRALQPDAIDARPEDAPAPAVDTAARRRFVLVVDRDHLYAGEGQQILQAAAKFIDGLPPGDGVALWTLPDSSTSLKFGEDREEIKRRLRRAVGTYRAVYGPWVVARDEAIRTEGPGGQEVLASIVARECDRQPPTCPAEVAAQARQTAMDARQRADAAIAPLGPLVDALGKVDGPKHLVLITGGPVTTSENIRDVAALGRRAGLARVTIHALQVPDPSYRARTDQMRAMPEDIDQSASAAYQLAGTTGRPRPHAHIGRGWLRSARAGAVGRLRAGVRNAAGGSRRQGARDFGQGAGRRLGRSRAGKEVLPRRSERRRCAGLWPCTSPGSGRVASSSA